MPSPFLRRTAAVLVILAHMRSAQALQQDLAINDIADLTIRAELLELGGYQELVQEFQPGTLVPVPLVHGSAFALTFRDAGIRVQVESLPFAPVPAPKRGADGWKLEGRPVIGWTPGDAHTRLARVELVLDGRVCALPPAQWLDVVDAPLLLHDVPYASVMRSADGWRTYVHLQAGEGSHGRMITWFFEDGVFRFRVVDEAPLW